MKKTEYLEWCEDCEFICKQLQFYSMKDFYSRSYYLYTLYNSMDRKGQMLYRWYIYSKPYLSQQQKVDVWDMLNGIKIIPTPDEVELETIDDILE